MTPEKDKEDQSKYYLRYPKSRVLKWANRDINAVKWASIPKFTTLDDIATPLLHDVLVYTIFDYTKLYSQTNEKIRLFLSVQPYVSRP